MFRIEERNYVGEYPEKSVTIWEVGEPIGQRPTYMAVWRLREEKASFVPLGSATTKYVWDTYGSGQQQSGTETSLDGGMGAKEPSNLRQSSSSEGKVITVLFFFPFVLGLYES